MLIGFKASGRFVILLFLSGLLVYEAFPQSPKQSTVPELKISRLTEKVVPEGWSRFSFGEPVLFNAIFPRQPQQLTNRIPGNDGIWTGWMFLAASDTAVYQINWGVDDKVAIKSEKEKLREYNNFAAGFVDGLVKTGNVKGGELTAERRVKLSGIDGFERDYSFTDHTARLQMFHTGKGSLTVASVWNSDNPPNERNSFFSSVTLEKGSEAIGPLRP